MKWRARAFNVLLSSARQRLTPLFSNYFLWILGGGEKQRRREPNYPPRCQAAGTPGSQVLPCLLPCRLHRCRSLPAPGQPCAVTATDAEGGWRKGKGMQLITRAKSEQDDTAEEKAAFIQAAKPHLNYEIPPGCFKTHAYPEVGMAAEAEGGHSSSHPVSLSPPSPSSSDGCKQCENTAHTPGVGVPLGADVAPLWMEIRKRWHRTPLPARSTARCQAPRPAHDSLQGSPWS